MQQFSDLVGQLYDAALTPDLWPATLQSLANAFGACFAGFGWEDTRIMAVGGSYGTQKLEGEAAETYRKRYKKLIYSNPLRVPVLMTQEVEDVYTVSMLVPMEEYHASLYYQEYVKPMGWHDGLSTILSKSDGVVHFIAFARRAEDPPFDEEDIALLKLLAPHVRRAYTISNLIGRQKAQVQALAETFDGLAASVFLLDAAMHVVYRNNSARALLAKGAPLLVLEERLGTTDRGTQAAFDAAIEAAGRDGSGGTALQSSLVLSGRNATRYVAHVLPLTTPPSAARRAVAALFVTEVGLDSQSPIQTIANAYGLTPREMSVLVAMVDIGTPADVAAQLGLTTSTVRSHLKAIFAKTGVNRQADLVKLVASHMSPIGGARDASRRRDEARNIEPLAR